QSTGVLPPTAQQVPPGYPGNAPAMANSSSGANSSIGSAGVTPDGMPPSSESPMLPKNSSGGPGSDWTYTMITADVRRNAVIIRDIRANMPLYEAAIRKLDVPVRVIEISAAIVDLKLGTSKTLGLNSFGISSGTTLNVGTNTLSLGGSAQSAPNAPPTNVGATGVFGTVAVTAAINALSAENKAKVLSRPTILTLDNFGAMINNQETFYVNSVGQYVSNLYNVSTGLSLQVIPHVTMHHGETRIYLQVQIQDGKATPANVGSLPTVEQSSLTTQSLIKEDQSLLIGGLYKKVNDKEASGYPWLYKLPVVSFLFGVKSSAKEMVERVFLITPRIVEINAKNLGDYSEYFKPSPTVETALEKEKIGEVISTLKPDPRGGSTTTSTSKTTTTSRKTSANTAGSSSRKTSEKCVKKNYTCKPPVVTTCTPVLPQHVKKTATCVTVTSSTSKSTSRSIPKPTPEATPPPWWKSRRSDPPPLEEGSE
ncbi:MAG TPA: secretin N-terminal domain-containing protein, partial [Chthoniobacterales bacterium]|nr:secretin N-terminal domain-containing protein [Chthoniobacterales bacterium]